MDAFDADASKLILLSFARYYLLSPTVHIPSFLVSSLTSPYVSKITSQKARSSAYLHRKIHREMFFHQRKMFKNLPHFLDCGDVLQPPPESFHPTNQFFPVTEMMVESCHFLDSLAL